MAYQFKVTKLDTAIYHQLDFLKNNLTTEHSQSKVFKITAHHFLIWFAERGSWVMMALILWQSVRLWSMRHSYLSLIFPMLSVAGAFAGRSINICVRKCVYRARPHVFYQAEPLLQHAPTSSFPSNHAAGAFALAVGMVPTGVYFGCAMFIAACLLAGTRLYVKLHYVTDVLAGALIGTIVSLILTHLVVGGGISL